MYTDGALENKKFCELELKRRNESTQSKCHASRKYQITETSKGRRRKNVHNMKASTIAPK